MPGNELKSACLKLIGRYATDNWWPSSSAFEVMIGAVLVQNTRWDNVESALHRLTDAACLEPRPLLSCPLEQLSELIRPAGCQRVKARRLNSLAEWIVTRGGVAHLDTWPTAKLRRALLTVHGIGPETADAILCFAFDRPVFIADQYTRRWMQRMGWIGSSDHGCYEIARSRAEGLLGDETDYKQVHAAIVLHGQSVCRRTPTCPDCLLNKRCQYYIKQ
jgi:endonuclease-3 related protein